MSADQILEDAANGAISWVPSTEVPAALLERLDELSELGWLLLDCGCLLGPEAVSLHACEQRAG